MSGPKYPDIKVKLVGEDGNAFAILRRVLKAMKFAGLTKTTLTNFFNQATSGDYDHLLQTCMEWVEVE